MYRVRDFAQLAGVTVRTLHHYDRLKLLCPRRTELGYRVYSERDLERLEQIVALRFIGLPLAEIKILLERDNPQLADALRQQHLALEEKRRLLDRTMKAIEEAQSILANEGQAPAGVLKKIIEVMEMQDSSNWAMKYYSDEAARKVEARKTLWSPELQERVSRQWMELFADVEANLDKDPAGPEAQALADRWQSLVDEFTGGDSQISTGLTAMYQDRPNWPEDFQQQMKPFGKAAVWAYMDRVRAARK
ncbi:MAG TPA: MerR family transcriptional regulator [Bryobacteraceae bacterium]|nr:MerR family transcriptional regulator [Bryobacteraceae bacterium]